MGVRLHDGGRRGLRTVAFVAAGSGRPRLRYGPLGRADAGRGGSGARRAAVPRAGAGVAAYAFRRGGGVVAVVALFRGAAPPAHAGGQRLHHRTDSRLYLYGHRFAVGLDDSPCAQQRHRLSDDDERARRPAADRHDRQPDPLLEYLYRCGGRHPRFGLDGVADAAAAQGPGGKSGVGVINGAFRR